MKFEVYCDESRQDLLSSLKSQEKYFLIGSLWMLANYRNDIKRDIQKLKVEHDYHLEIKWKNVTSPTLPFFQSLIDLFIETDKLRFRCIAVEAKKVNLIKYHKNDTELGFYKFYYQVLNNWLLDFNQYFIFCDLKTNRNKSRLNTLLNCLQCSNLSSNIIQIQAIPSKESLLIQLTDILLGAASSRINNSLEADSAKMQFIQYLEQKLGIQEIQHTSLYEKKFNVFKIDLDGGW